MLVFSFSSLFWKESESQILFAGSFSSSGHSMWDRPRVSPGASSSLHVCSLPGSPEPVLLLSVSSRADDSQCLSSDSQAPHVCSISIPHLTFYSPPPIPKDLFSHPFYYFHKLKLSISSCSGLQPWVPLAFLFLPHFIDEHQQILLVIPSKYTPLN